MIYNVVHQDGERGSMDKKTRPTSIRLSEEGKQLRKLLAKKLGLSESAVVELAIRKLAESEGVSLPAQRAM